MTVNFVPFANEPLIDFSDPARTAEMADARRRVRERLGGSYPLIIGGERVKSAGTFRSYNPSRRDEVIGEFALAEPQDVDHAVRVAEETFDRWSRVAVAERVAIFLRAADLLRRRRMLWLAYGALEVGKPFAEGDGEGAESVDHFEWMARQAVRVLQGLPLHAIPEEINEYTYIPLGVGAIISPWNFPFAIPLGMILGSIVCGNTVVWKPASDAAAIAHEIMDLLTAAGVPAGVVNLLTGSGKSTGERLVRHPRVRYVAFTGSKEVGIRIHEQAAHVEPGQIWIKRSLLEMGGKNAVIVDGSADLQAAAVGAVKSAYGYQGQKCSCASRLIVTRDVYAKVLERVVAETARLSVGPAEENHQVGPLINEKAYRKVLEYLALGRTSAKLALGGDADERDGWFVTPTVYYDVDPSSPLGQDEIFGPVLSVIPAHDLDDALRIANGTEFGLTGAVYSRDPWALGRVRELFHVGNLYINRTSTGAMVGVHPFGGFNMSGTDSKVGGPEYLGFYLQAKAITERVRP